MTNQRICDVCDKPIPKGQDYIKLQLIKHIDKKQVFEGVGHMCLACWEKTK